MAGQRVSVEVYETMWTAYQQAQSAEHVSNETGVHHTTAKKYIEQGDSDRNLPPLAERFREWIAEVHKKLDRPAAEIRADRIRKLDAVFEQTFENLVTRQQGYIRVITSDSKKACPACGKPTAVDYVAVKPYLATPRDVAAIAKTLDDMLGGADAMISDKIQKLSVLMIETWKMVLIPPVSFYLHRLRQIAETIDIEGIDPEQIPDPVGLVNSAAVEVGERLLAIAKGPETSTRAT